MKINEIIGRGRWYECRVRIVCDGINVTVTSLVNGDSRSGVVAMLAKLYGKNNVLSCNEISEVLSEKALGAPKARTLHHDVMKRRPYTAQQLQVKSLEKKARDEVDSGDVPGAAQARAEVALKKAQIRKSKAQQDYTNKAMNLSKSRGLMSSIT
jgi:hypothetical protein